jgi:hypothetical protein
MTHPTNKVPFSLAGDGAHLRYRTADLVKLRETYGEPKIVKTPDVNGILVETWETFTDRIEERVRLNDPIAIIDCLKAGLKHEDGTTKWDEISYDDLPFGLIQAAGPITTALVLGITGKDYAVLLRERAAKAAEEERLRAAGVEFNEDSLPDPLMTLTDSTLSGEFSGSDTEPAS